MKVLSRVQGCLLGLAVGDALGAPYEFKPPTAFRITPGALEMHGGGSHGLAAGEWTDDTAQALALADSLLLRGGFDPHDYLKRLLAWRDFGLYSCTGKCFDIGGGTSAALKAYSDSLIRQEYGLGNPEPYIHARKTSSNRGLGNGALMRVAPVALWARSNVEARDVAQEQTLTTHPDIDNATACTLYVARLRLCLEGKCDEPRTVATEPIDGRGHYADSYAIVKMIGLSATSYEQAVEQAIAIGYDTDTNAAIVGALAGARFGVENIPTRWLDKLAWREQIGDLSVRLARRGGWID